MKCVSFTHHCNLITICYNEASCPAPLNSVVSKCPATDRQTEIFGGCQIWSESWSDWSNMGQTRDFFISYFSTFWLQEYMESYTISIYIFFSFFYIYNRSLPLSGTGCPTPLGPIHHLRWMTSLSDCFSFHPRLNWWLIISCWGARLHYLTNPS